MSGEIKFDENNAISLENSSYIKEEFQDEYYLENKVCISETTITDTINISNSEFNTYIRNDIKKQESLSVDHIYTDLPLTEVSSIIKEEDQICPADVQIVFGNEPLCCNHCNEVYQDYCTKCRVLVHILNKIPYHNIHDRIEGLPKYMLETRESIGYLGIFSLKVIPEDVRFGPFTGLNTAGLSLKIKGGRFTVNNDKLKHLNWMHCINPARNIYEQNLFPFQYEDRLYYCSTRRIQEGEELLVYFGEQYEDNLLKNVEMDFVPITKEDVENVFACTSCCLGFSAKKYLAEHKAMCHDQTKEMFSVEELAQCPFCKIYLEAKEYFQHHMDYCCETKDRHCIFPSPEVCELQVERRSSVRTTTKRWKHGICKCTQCKFRTMYNADFRHHTNGHCEVKMCKCGYCQRRYKTTRPLKAHVGEIQSFIHDFKHHKNEHYIVKMYKCGICHRRYKTKRSLKVHVEKIHANNVGRDAQKYSTCDYLKSNIKNIKTRSPHSHDGEKESKFSNCKIETRDKCHLKSCIKIKHLNRRKYKCANCKFKTYYRSYLEMHLKIKHLTDCNYKCAECEFKTDYKASLVRHIKAKHLKEKNYSCAECDFKTNYKSNLEVHIKKHLKQKDYKCAECDYETNFKSQLKGHVKTNHLKEHDYKCMECEFKTNFKAHLKVHVKTKHLKERDYKCMECEFKTYYKSRLRVHVKTKHLNEHDFKCMECEFKTNFKSNLKVHVKAKHLKERDYKCMECEYMTNRKADLDRHKNAKHLKENNFKCTECEYKSNYKADLEKHIRTKHLNERDYKCAECKFKTSYKSHLGAHVKTKHLKESDYKCVKCEYKTNYKQHLRTHIKIKHFNQSGLQM